MSQMWESPRIRGVYVALSAVLALGLLFAPVGSGSAQTKSKKKPKKPAATKPAKKPAAPRPLLANADFESGTDGAPNDWQQGADVPGVEYLWDRKTAHQGKASLCLRKTFQRYFPIAQWTQTIPNKRGMTSLKTSAWVKAEKAHKAILDVQFLDTNGEAVGHKWAVYIGAKEQDDPPADHDWKKYEGTVDIPENAAHVAIALQIYGPGTVWFDDISVEFVK